MQRFTTSGLILVALSIGLWACGKDDDDDAPSCFEGCEAAADPVACVAACQGGGDSDAGGETDAGDDPDVSTPDTSGTPDVEGPDDTTTGEDTPAPDDTTTGEDAVSPPDTSPEEDLSGPVTYPVPAVAEHVTCDSLSDCVFRYAPDSAEGAACAEAAMPTVRTQFESLEACARTFCLETWTSDPALLLGCLITGCTGAFEACTASPGFYDGCGSVDDCVLACDKRDGACRTACLDGAPEAIAAVALGHFECVKDCYSRSNGQDVCAAVECADIYDACHGEDRGWNCPAVIGCTQACLSDDLFCISQCKLTSSSPLANESAEAVVLCGLDAGCYSGDSELAALCLAESCPAETAICVRYPERTP
jgi:hypothetical protein